MRVDLTAMTKPADRVAVVATEPLTSDEAWTAGEPGTLWVFRDGELRASLPSHDPDGRPERPVVVDSAAV